MEPPQRARNPGEHAAIEVRHPAHRDRRHAQGRGSHEGLPSWDVQAQPLLGGGGYVPDGIMIDMIRDRLRDPDCARGFILDGFPRTIPQAEALDVLMKELGRRFDRVLYLRSWPLKSQVVLPAVPAASVCPGAEVPAHLPAPGGTEAVRGRRHDSWSSAAGRQAGEPLQPRIGDRPPQTIPVLDHYRSEDLVSEIDGRGSIDEISRQVLSAIGQNGQVSRR